MLCVVNNKQNHYIPAANKQVNPAGFLRLCRGDSGSPVPPDTSCASPWPIGGLSSDPPILWDYVKMEEELIGQSWLLKDTSGGLAALVLVFAGTVKTPHMIFAPVIQPFPEPFLSVFKTMASCVPQRKAEEF